MTLKNNKILSKIMFTFLVMFLGVLKTSASCSYVEKANLNEIASDIKTNYEVIEEEVIKDFIDPDTQETGTYKATKRSFKISIYNLTEEVYIVETNNLNNDKKEIFYRDTNNGIYTYISEDIENIIKYEYVIKSNIKTCFGEVLKSYNFTKPKVNMYSQYAMCEGLEDNPYCRVYITEDLNIDESQIEKKLDNYIVEEKEEIKSEESKKNKKYVYITVGAGLIVGTLGTMIIVKRRSKL